MTYRDVGQVEKTEFVGTIKGFKLHESSLIHPLKVKYNSSKSEYEAIPRPIANFNENEESIAAFLVARRKFLSIKPQSPK